MATLIKTLLNLFKRKKAPPLACHVSLDQDENHVHTAACFLEIEPLAVAELFQAQGCVSCPPAVPGILEATRDPNIQLLTYGVTYFDHLVKDPNASSRWDQRQKSYVMKWGRNSLFTPMVVANGVSDGGSGGGSKAEIEGVVRQARNMAHQMIDWHIYVDANDTHVRIDSDKLEIEMHEVLVIMYKDKEEVVKISKGPNKGKKMPHKNLVTDIVKIGEWHGGDTVVALPAQMTPGGAVVVVQAPRGGAIVGACKLRLQGGPFAEKDDIKSIDEQPCGCG
ncbi:thioredoxin-like protein [Stachybotrys elegans]|uniref:Thioredoxin-like protein n=1 Tax=Stachybotrys elegans TaxID=80388 RepID=A0A8K0SBK6_9HYPO|nr:thioredoxin-like protein [Stachybotrys elegans]